MADRKVEEIEKELTSATRDGVPVGDLTDYKAQVGDVLSYKITVTNTGNVPLENVVVEGHPVGNEYIARGERGRGRSLRLMVNIPSGN